MSKHTHTVVVDNMSSNTIIEAMAGSSEEMLSEFLQQNRAAERRGWACTRDEMDEDGQWDVTYKTPDGEMVVVTYAEL